MSDNMVSKAANRLGGRHIFAGDATKKAQHLAVKWLDMSTALVVQVYVLSGEQKGTSEVQPIKPKQGYLRSSLIRPETVSEEHKLFPSNVDAEVTSNRIPCPTNSGAPRAKMYP